MKRDWDIVHKETCTEEPDKRKVKAGKKKRTEAGMKQQKKYLKESTNVALANRRSRAASVLKEVAAACNEGNKEEKKGNKEEKKGKKEENEDNRDEKKENKEEKKGNKEDKKGKKSRQKSFKDAAEGARGSEVD